MPVALLGVIIFIGVIFFFSGLIRSERAKQEFYMSGKERAVICVFGLLLILVPVVWMIAARDQDILVQQYHYMDIVVNQDGQTQYYVYPQFFNDKPEVVDVKFTSGVKVALPPDSIVKVWKYNKWKCGMSWMNDMVFHCEVITPSDSEYNNVKDQARRKILKEN